MDQQYRLEDCSVQCAMWKCHLVFERYGQTCNIRIAFIADSPEEDSGETIAVASTNGDGKVSLPDDRVMFKNWTENRDVVDILQAAGVIGPSEIGGYRYPVYPLLKKPKLFPAKVPTQEMNQPPGRKH
jgi:hypothetical protein